MYTHVFLLKPTFRVLIQNYVTQCYEIRIITVDKQALLNLTINKLNKNKIAHLTPLLLSDVFPSFFFSYDYL